MCAHNATHIDAPYHFFDKGRTIEQIELFRCVGPCTVIELSKEYTREKLLPILEKSQKRLLIKGESAVTPELARLFHEHQILLVGVEPQSVSSTDPVPVHHELLGKEVVLLEGLVLKEVEPGDYFLCAAPLKLGGSDGAPCRAFLIDFGAGEECLC
jgi:arylformamidase